MYLREEVLILVRRGQYHVDILGAKRAKRIPYRKVIPMYLWYLSFMCFLFLCAKTKVHDLASERRHIRPRRMRVLSHSRASTTL